MDKNQAVPPKTPQPLEARISFRYPDYPGLPSISLFEGLELKLKRGKIHLIIGPTDAGKTTLSRILMGLIPGHTGGRFQGEVLWDGIPVENIPPREFLQKGGLLFQDPEEQLLSPRCEEEAAFALESLGVPGEEMRLRVDEALAWMGLSGYRDRNPGTLSGGEQKRLLAAALKAQDPGLWILDEIFEELDQTVRKTLLSTLNEKGRTVLIFASKDLPLFDEFHPESFLLEGKVLIPLPPKGPERQALLVRAGLDFPPRPGLPVTPGKPPGRPVLSLTGIRFAWPKGDFSLFLDSLVLREGEITVVLGPNGSGKSTLGRILCGLLTPSAGEIRVFPGINPSADPDGGITPGPVDLHRYCGYLFQNPDYQLFLPTVLEELLYGTPLKYRKEGLRKAAEAQKMFRLPGGEAPPALLSFGGRKRLQGAIGSLLERPVLILDEGDSGLTYGDFLDMVENLRSPRRALVIITHQEELALRLADQRLSLENGRIKGSRP